MNDSDNVTVTRNVSLESDMGEKLRYDVIRVNLIRYTSPMLLVCGLVGNLLILAVLRRRELGHMPPAPYLAALAIADIVVLYSGLVAKWMYDGYGINFRETDIGSKLIIYVIYSSVHASAWLVVAVTVDRFVSIWFPFRALKIQRKHRIGAAASVVVTCLCINIHFLIFIKSKSIQIEYMVFIIKAWTILDLFIASVGPFIIISTCNIGIIVASRRSSSLRNTLRSEIQRNPVREKKREEARLTRLLVILNLFFILTTCPIAAMKIYNVNRTLTLDQVSIARDTLIDAVLALVMYLNNALNFALYCFTGKQFRVALLAMFRCRNTKTDTAHSGVSTSYSLP